MGKYCINRLTNSDDISGFTINGKDYTVPWNRHEKPTDLGIRLFQIHTNEILFQLINVVKKLYKYK